MDHVVTGTAVEVVGSDPLSDLAVLPPYNTLWAQVVRIGDPPQIVTRGITVTYLFTDNTYSVGKSDFWSYTLPLFGSVLTPNIGLTGKGLSGPMDNRGDHFSADGIPLTEFRDSAPAIAYPYQIATIIVSDAGNGAELAARAVDGANEHDAAAVPALRHLRRAAHSVPLGSSPEAL